MIKVDPGAQHKDAFPGVAAHADAIRVWSSTNDICCTDAAAIAQIDQGQLLYLFSRGLPKEVTTRLLIECFVGREPRLDELFAA